MGSNIVRFDQIRGMQAADITGSYQGLGFNFTSVHPPTPAPFTHAMRVLHFYNDTGGPMMVSFDGTIDNAFIPPNSFALYDLTSDQDANESFRYQNGTQIYVRYLIAPGVSAAPSTNTFYMVAIFGKGE